MIIENRVLAEIAFASITVLAYILSYFIYKKSKLLILHPVFTSLVSILLILKLMNISPNEYVDNNKAMRLLLDISVVALGYLLYEHYDLLKQNLKAILLSQFIGSIVGILSVTSIAYILGADNRMIATLAPKSVTTPIAVGLSADNGGFVPITVSIVILCGIFGAISGPFILKWFNITHPLSKGIALGASSHGIGTSKAVEMGLKEGAAGGVSIAITGVFTSILIKILSFFLS